MMIETGILWIVLLIVCVLLFFLQRDLCRRFKTKFTDDISSGDESSVPSDTNEIVKINTSIEQLYVKETVTVDTNEQFTDEIVPVQKSDSDEGDFEVISKEQLNDMDDNQNGVEHNAHDDGGERRFSVSEEGEINDKFPQQMTTKNSNWNMMELGEKRKRLR